MEKRRPFMTERKEAIACCLTLKDVYEDYPFHDPNWCVIRHRENNKVFAWIFDRNGHVWINVKSKFVSTEQGEFTRDILQEFDELWNAPNTQSYSDFIEDYKLNYLREKMVRQQRKSAMQEQPIELERYKLVPNKMQVAFVQNILQLRRNHVQKALLTSSTGTGKTMASAFAIRELHPAKMLFVVHREQIAKQALKSYKRIFGVEKTYGLLSGNQKDMAADCIFSTIQMMAKPEIHTKFDANTFDVIVLDECHHAGSDSYQRIMSYFKPKF